MIDWWLDLPDAGIAAALIGFYGATGSLVAWLCFGRTCRAWVLTLSGVVVPFFSSIAILFALLTSVLANDVGQRNRQAGQAVQAEAAAAGRILALVAAVLPDRAAITGPLQAYLRSVLEEEWPAMAAGRSSDRTGALFADLLRVVTQPKIAAEAGVVVAAGLLNGVIALGTARSDRLAAGGDSTSALKWTTVLLLGVLVQVALGIVHLDRQRAQAAALVMFSAAASAALGLLALQEKPFTGSLQVSPLPLVRAADLISS